MSILSTRPIVQLGEVLQPSDFNTLSAGNRAYLNDFILAARMRLAQFDNGPTFSASAQLYAIGHSGGPRTSATARNFGCNSGPLFYVPPSVSVDGVTPKTQCYYLQQNEISGACAAADPTNPRFDAVYVRLSEVDGSPTTQNFEDATGVKTSQSMVTNRQVKLEFQIVTGLAAAKPQIPTGPDSTWARWTVFWVPATFNASFGLPHIYDYRVPIDSWSRQFVGAHDMLPFTSANLTVDKFNGTAAFANSGTEVLGKCRIHSGRMMGAGYTWLSHNVGDPFRVRVNYMTVGGSSAVDAPFRRTGYPNAAMGTTAMDNLFLINGQWWNNSLSLQTTSSDGYALLPLWANGYGCETEDASGQGGNGWNINTTGETAYVCGDVSGTVGTTLFGFSFDVAGG